MWQRGRLAAFMIALGAAALAQTTVTIATVNNDGTLQLFDATTHDAIGDPITTGSGFIEIKTQKPADFLEVIPSDAPTASTSPG